MSDQVPMTEYEHFATAFRNRVLARCDRFRTSLMDGWADAVCKRLSYGRMYGVGRSVKIQGLTPAEASLEGTRVAEEILLELWGEGRAPW
jgi:hypothetical protein